MRTKPAVYGAGASIALLGLYVLTMTFLSGWVAAIEQFRALWYLMVPLTIGFGVQVGLYVRLKEAIRQKTQNVLAASGTSAGVSMLACCAHHATDFLPLVGLAGLSIFLLQYQIPILIISVGINIVGIFVMLKHLKMVSL